MYGTNYNTKIGTVIYSIMSIIMIVDDLAL